MNLSLQGRHALVCGSTQGIGLAIANELALLGANCTLLARNEDKLKQILPSLDRSKEQKHDYAVADFNDPSQVRSVVNRLLEKGPVHILINNTGGPKPGSIVNEEEQKFLDAFNQHLICNQLLATAVIPGMKEAEFGRIINILSTSVRIPIYNLGVSNTIRAAVASWAKTLSNEVGKYKITVNSILPGYTETGRLASLIDENAMKANTSVEKIAAELKARIPVARFGEPAEIAAVAAFLASPAASFVNGITIPVDGGSTGTI